jgi:L-arabinose transport system substrate-binding protein
MKLHRRTLNLLLLGTLGFWGGTAYAAEEIKIGFLVKQPADSWFQDEWRFAEKAASDKGFKLIKIGVSSRDKLMTAMDNLVQQKAQGVVVCVPDVTLGNALVAKAAKNKLKLMTVDDRLIDDKRQSIESVPHMGISAFKIGEQVGNEIAAEAQRRGWKLGEVGLIRVTFDQLPTAKDRTDGAVAALTKSGFPAANVINAPQKTSATEDAFDAAELAMTQLPKFKKWMAIGVNDETVLGAVRAAEGKGIKADAMIAVGIGGSASALSEFNKAELSAFHATVLISPKRHGYETAANMFEWIKTGKEPEKLIETAGAIALRSNFKEVRATMGL